jgi:predicted CopG family antitoxin
LKKKISISFESGEIVNTIWISIRRYERLMQRKLGDRSFSHSFSQWINEAAKQRLEREKTRED